jgi:chitinase
LSLDAGDAGSPPPAVNAVSVALSPLAVSLSPGATQAFAAGVANASDARVTWSVQEGASGGAITSAGLYTAPAAAGTYHVVARSTADETKTAVAAVSVSAPVPSRGGAWVTGYYVGYQATMYPAAQVDFSAITHLVVGALMPRADGTLDQTFYIDAVNGPAMARDLAGRAHAAGRKAIAMVGGSGSQAIWRGAASAANLPAFVDNLIGAMQNLGFDGLDLDWEPLSSADQPLLLALVKALRAKAPAALLTAPIYFVTGSADPGYAQLAPYLDQMNIMSYGMAGAWPGWMSWHSAALGGESTLYPSSVSASAVAYAAAGVPKAKIGVGIGFYGTCWTGVTGPRQNVGGAKVVASDNVMSWSHIAGAYFSTAAYRWDDAAKAAYLSFPQAAGPEGCNFVSYEDDASIAAKGQWVRANGYGGTIIWTINQGYVASSATNPPLDAVKRAFLQ